MLKSPFILTLSSVVKSCFLICMPIIHLICIAKPAVNSCEKGCRLGQEETSNFTKIDFRIYDIMFIIQAIHCISTMLTLLQPLDSGSTKKNIRCFYGGEFDSGGRGNRGILV